MTAPSTPGKVVVYRLDTGEAFERWPVDAREMLATGAYTRTAPGSAGGAIQAPPAPTPDPVPHVAAAKAAMANHPHALINREPEPAPAAIPPAEVPAPTPAPVPEWPMKWTPERYLERNPNGPNADLARAVLAARQ